MISINLYESSDGLFVEETITPTKKEHKEAENLITIDELQMQLITVESIRDDRPPVSIPAQTLLTVV